MKNKQVAMIPNIKRVMKKTGLLMFCIALLLQFTRCMGINYRKYSWSSTECAPEGYPAAIVGGLFVLPVKGGIGIRGSAYSNNGWGGTGSTTTDNDMPAPIMLDIVWFSFTENKFYEGTFDLPQKKIDSLMSEGYIDPTLKRHDTYDEIIVGMAPGGVCVVWLNGAGNTVEIGRYQAQETEVSLKEFIPMSYYERQPDQKQAQADYAQMMMRQDSVAQKLEQNGIPFGLWDTYRERFNWRPTVVYEDIQSITDDIRIEYYNGEMQSLVLEQLRENPFQMRPRVRSINATWSFGDICQNVEIEFNEKEIFETFDSLWHDNPLRPVELQLSLNKSNDHCRVFLVSCDEEYHKRIELKKARIKIYTITSERVIKYLEVNLNKK